MHVQSDGCGDERCADRFCDFVQRSNWSASEYASAIRECDRKDRDKCCMLAIVDKPMRQTTYTQVALRAQASWSPVKRLTLSRLVQTAISRAVEVVSQKEVTIARAVEVTVPVVTDVAATRLVVQVVMKPVEVTKQVEVPIVSFMAVNVSTNVTKTKEVPITQVITRMENITQMEAITEVINITTYSCSACAS